MAELTAADNTIVTASAHVYTGMGTDAENTFRHQALEPNKPG